jgi:predicted acetyltransferase
VAYELRPITIDEYDDFSTANAGGFGWEPNADMLAENLNTMELDRTLATFDGPEVVSTTAIISFDLTVPGGTLPAAGVTWVAVKPTHRRRGILRDMMARQLSDIHDRGEALAALWASESVIYGRFGYGLGAQNIEFKVDRVRTTLAGDAPVCGRTRMMTREQALESWPAVYDEARRARPGFFSRSEAWWQYHTIREKDFERRMGSRFFVQYEEDGAVRGYARYRVRPGQDGMASGTLLVQELTALTSNAYSALWQYVFGVDLIATIEANHRPQDEPLYWMLADPRRMVRSVYDTLWVRVLDVPAALEGRRYAWEGSVVLDVRDSFCPWVQGRYELEMSPDGAKCTLTDAEPDVTLSAADLGAIYLGGEKLTTLARAGRVEGDYEALRRADVLLSWDRAPWCPEVF